eukprot:Nk52_evm1s2573 gene=Nk52_evmTU1s2573
MSRPELLAPPEIFYDDIEARKYTQNSRMIDIQSSMTERCIELLNLGEDPSPKFLLDIGCGSGISGDCLSEQGHFWCGMDISRSMLGIAKERECEGDLFHQDMGQGMGFRPGTFDGCISVSALQWLCNADKRHHVPHKRLLRFFQTLYASLTRGARAVFQFYPQDSKQMEMITAAAMKSGFTGGLVIDYPNSTKAKKMFLCLFAGVTDAALPKGLGTETEQEQGQHNRRTQVQYGGEIDGDERRRHRHHRNKNGKRVGMKSKEWIMSKKDRARRQGKEVREDTKFTGRKRRVKF